MSNRIDYAKLSASRATWEKLASMGGVFGKIGQAKLKELDAPTAAQLVPPPPAPSAVLAPQINKPRVGAADLALPTIQIPRG